MQQRTQVHNQYLIDVRIILGVALLNKAHFFKVTNDFNVEIAKLEKEQAQDLKVPCMSWWDQNPMTEDEYFNQLAEIHG